jgi:hypothetical protein
MPGEKPPQNAIRICDDSFVVRNDRCARAQNLTAPPGKPAESRYSNRTGLACGAVEEGYHTNADRKPPGKLQFHQFHRSFMFCLP